ncbi:hypothetical protein FACS1894132_02310 [Clostridia bacterium]|nr:hypothetical protein FACS1894132_02310 [Clostridia bacterium]
MPERPICANNLRENLKDLRRHGFAREIDGADTLLSAMKCRDASPAKKVSYFLTLVKAYIDDPCDVEILLASMGLLEGYESIRGVNNRRLKYYENGYPEGTWKIPVDSLRDIEDRVMEKLISRTLTARDLPAVLARLPENSKLPTPQYYQKKRKTVTEPESMTMTKADGEAIEERITDEAQSIVEMINARTETIGAKILEELHNSNKEQDTSQAVGDYPFFIASSFWFSRISSKSKKNQVLYRNGYGENDAVVVVGKMGHGRFAVISSEYVFMGNPSNSLNDVPQAQNDMLVNLLQNLGSDFNKKKVGLSCGHCERVTADNFNPVIRQHLSLLGVSAAACPLNEINSCDIFIVGAPLEPFNSDEQDSLEAFVLDGGRVIFCGCGSYWVTADDENGMKRKVEDYPINMLAKTFGFRIEADCASKYIMYAEKKNALFFTPIFHVNGIYAKSGDEQSNSVISNALAGNSDAQRALAECYRSGNGVPKNYDYALYWYKMSAFASNALSQYYLGLCYCDSFANGIYTNHRLYKIWLALSAKNNELRALSQLGVDTYYGYNGMTKDEQKGAEVIKRAALQGRHNAQYHLGKIYLERGSYKEAGEWLFKACSGDNVRTRAEAHYQLAFLLRDGKSFEEDIPTAVHHLLLSAKEGNKKAIAVLGQPENGFWDYDDHEIFEKLVSDESDITQILRDLRRNNNKGEE